MQEVSRAKKRFAFLQRKKIRDWAEMTEMTILKTAKAKSPSEKLKPTWAGGPSFYVSFFALNFNVAARCVLD
jgi:hypothetical protein